MDAGYRVGAVRERILVERGAVRCGRGVVVLAVGDEFEGVMIMKDTWSVSLARSA